METRPAPLADRRTRLARNRRFRALGIPYKTCSSCFAVKAHGAFPAAKGYPDGRHHRCYTCDAARKRTPEYRTHAREGDRRRLADPARRAAKNARTREWKVSNPDKHRAANQRRRATKAAAQVEDFTRADLLAYWDEIGSYGCVFCGGPYEHDEHIQPLSLGGEHSRANLLPSCATCNSSKGASDPIDYVNQRYGLRLSWPTERL